MCIWLSNEKFCHHDVGFVHIKLFIFNTNYCEWASLVGLPYYFTEIVN